MSNGTSSMSIEERVQEIQSHKFTHLHQNHKTWLISLAYSSISDGGVTTLLHTLINFNSCCIQRYKSHIHRSYGSGDMIAQSYPCTPKTTKHAQLHGLIAPKSDGGCHPHHVRIFRKYRNRSLTWCKSGLHSSLRSWATGAWISPISEASSWIRCKRDMGAPWYGDPRLHIASDIGIPSVF